jgi:3-hydroxyisobutyrate dehydrogenase
MFETFDDIRADIAGRLVQGACDRKSAMHTPVVATTDADARVMVLRAFDADRWMLRFHTDARSPKCLVIGSGAPVGVLAYDREAKIQLRVRGQGRVETDTALVQQAWEESTNFAKRCYLGDGPGAASGAPTSGLPEWAEGIQPTDEQIMPARENFAILLIELHHLDWFYLANSGHIRAQFARLDDDWEGRWVAP